MIIRVPATSANLGPGFDAFGMAWQLYNEFEFLTGDDGLTITGCDEIYRNRDNLAYVGYRETVKAAGLTEKPLIIRFLRSDIPLTRGLGSSSSLIVAGIMAANVIHGLGMSQRELLSAATAIEGHPDNVAPAILGGLTASAMAEGQVYSVNFPVGGKLRFTALIPDFELSTALARQVLPRQVPREDAVFNMSRAALLLKALETGDDRLLPIAMDDTLHQPYRSHLIPFYDEARSLALRCGALGFCLSGAGPTLLCVSPDPDFTRHMTEEMRTLRPAWQVLPLLPDFDGARYMG